MSLAPFMPVTLKSILTLLVVSLPEDFGKNVWRNHNTVEPLKCLAQNNDFFLEQSEKIGYYSKKRLRSFFPKSMFYVDWELVLVTGNKEHF